MHSFPCTNSPGFSYDLCVDKSLAKWRSLFWSQTHVFNSFVWTQTLWYVPNLANHIPHITHSSYYWPPRDYWIPIITTLKYLPILFFFHSHSHRSPTLLRWTDASGSYLASHLQSCSPTIHTLHYNHNDFSKMNILLHYSIHITQTLLCFKPANGFLFISEYFLNTLIQLIKSFITVQLPAFPPHSLFNY